MTADSESRPPQAPLLLNYEQAAARLNVSEGWLKRYAQARRIPVTRLGGLVRFSEQDIEDIIAMFGQVAVTSPRRTRRVR